MTWVLGPGLVGEKTGAFYEINLKSGQLRKRLRGSPKPGRHQLAFSFHLTKCAILESLEAS